MTRTTLELIKHIKSYRKTNDVTKDEIIFKLVNAIREEGIGETILGLFEIDPATPSAKRVTPPKITRPRGFISSHRTGSLSSAITPAQIDKALGGKQFRDSSFDEYKVKFQWSFLVDGVECSIWDYKGSKWSTYGPAEAFAKVGLTVITG